MLHRLTLRGLFARADRGVWVRLSVLVVIVTVGGALLLVFGVPDFEAVHAEILALGVWAPVLFVLVFVGLTTAPFPKSVLSVAAGAVWGLGWGLALGVLAGVLGASLSFGLARVLGRDAVSAIVGPQLGHLGADLGRRGFVAVLACRLIPVLPFTLLNYAFGVTSVRYPAFLLGTAIGIIPGTAAYTAVGAFGGEPFTGPFWLALGGLGVLTLTGLFAARRRHRPASAEVIATGERPATTAPQSIGGRR